MRRSWAIGAAAAILAIGSPVRAADPDAADSKASPPAGGGGAPAAAAPNLAAPNADASATKPGPTAPKAAAVTSDIKRFPKLRPPSLLHRNQLGIALLPGVGFRGIFPYEEGIPCGQQGKRVCTGRLPFFLDVQPSFGFSQHWDVLIDLRFGIEGDFTQSRQFAIAPGFRYWVDPDLPYKFFATIQGVFDATAQNSGQVSNNDFGIRNANGFMFEVMRNLGIYIQFGETIGFSRWLRFEIDGGVGFQARIP